MAQPERHAWHPILNSVESEFGIWHIRDQDGREYGVVKIVRLGGRPCYRAEMRGQLLGYGESLRSSIERVHAAWLRTHGPNAKSNG